MSAVVLSELTDRIGSEHAAAESAARRAVEHARTCGELLLEAKALVAHGQWSTWLAENFRGSERTAQAYMRLAKNWSVLEAKSQRVADLPLREALRLLSEPPAAPRELATPEAVREFLGQLDFPGWWAVHGLLDPLRASLVWLRELLEQADSIQQLRDVADLALAVQNTFAKQRLLVERDMGAMLAWAAEQGLPHDARMAWLDRLTDDQFAAMASRTSEGFQRALAASVMEAAGR